MAIDINEFLTTQAVVDAYDLSAADQSGYINPSLFPYTKQKDLEISAIQGRAGLPVALKPAEFDTLAPYRERLTFEMTKMSMPFFRERMRIDEKLRRDLVTMEAKTNYGLISPYLDQIFNDTSNLLKGAAVIREYMATSILATGKVVINGYGTVGKTFDYQFDREQFKTAKIKWDQPTAVPLEDVFKWVQDYKKKFGITLTEIIMSAETWALLAKNASLLKMMYPDRTDVSGIILADEQIRNLFRSYARVTVGIYDEYYAEEVQDVKNGASKPFYPYGKVTLKAAGTMGNMVFSMTPEEIDLVAGLNQNEISIVDTAVAIAKLHVPHPVSHDIVASQIVLPSLNTVGSNIVIADVV